MNFGGELTQRFITPTGDFDITGTCEVGLAGIELSTDGGETWIDQGPCPANGQFSMRVHVTKISTFLLRGRHSSGYTRVATAVVRFVFPETSPNFTFASSARSDEDDVRGSQNVVSSDFSGETLVSPESATHPKRLQTFVSGVIYDQD